MPYEDALPTRKTITSTLSPYLPDSLSSNPGRTTMTAQTPTKISCGAARTATRRTLRRAREEAAGFTRNRSSSPRACLPRRRSIRHQTDGDDSIWNSRPSRRQIISPGLRTRPGEKGIQQGLSNVSGAVGRTRCGARAGTGPSPSREALLRRKGLAIVADWNSPRCLSSAHRL